MFPQGRTSISALSEEVGSTFEMRIGEQEETHLMKRTPFIALTILCMALVGCASTDSTALSERNPTGQPGYPQATEPEEMHGHSANATGVSTAETSVKGGSATVVAGNAMESPDTTTVKTVTPVTTETVTMVPTETVTRVDATLAPAPTSTTTVSGTSGVSSSQSTDTTATMAGTGTVTTTTTTTTGTTSLDTTRSSTDMTSSTTADDDDDDDTTTSTRRRMRKD